MKLCSTCRQMLRGTKKDYKNVKEGVKNKLEPALVLLTRYVLLLKSRAMWIWWFYFFTALQLRDLEDRGAINCFYLFLMSWCHWMLSARGHQHLASSSANQTCDLSCIYSSFALCISLWKEMCNRDLFLSKNVLSVA